MYFEWKSFNCWGFVWRIKFQMSLNSWRLFEASYPSFIKNIYNSYRYLFSTEHYTYAFVEPLPRMEMKLPRRPTEKFTTAIWTYVWNMDFISKVMCQSNRTNNANFIFNQMKIEVLKCRLRAILNEFLQFAIDNMIGIPCNRNGILSIESYPWELLPWAHICIVSINQNSNTTYIIARIHHSSHILTPWHFTNNIKLCQNLFYCSVSYLFLCIYYLLVMNGKRKSSDKVTMAQFTMNR